MEFLQKLFKLKEHHTDIKTEIIAGITTFMTMSYILAVNPNILSATGMDKGALFVATALISCIGSFLMAILANYPFAIAPGMGLNAFFAYTVVLQMGYSWQVALTAVLAEGVIFILLSVLKIREAIFDAIPKNLKIAVSSGIGLFIAFIGLQNAHIVIDSPTLVSIFSLEGFKALSEANAAASYNDVGITVLLAIIGTLITAMLISKRVKGNIFLGMLITWFLGIICQITGLYVPNPDLGFYSLFPDFSAGIHVPSLSPIFMKFDFSKLLSFDFIVVMCAFLFVDMFDTIGCLIGMATKADMLDKDGKLPNIRGALLADAVATTLGAVFGTSTATTFIESAAGVAEGGRTGLTSVTTAVFFGLSLLLSPIFLAIPSFATAPALIMVGFYMFTSVAHMNFDEEAEAIPCYICILAMPFFYSISEGISMGVITYTALALIHGKAKKMSWLMYLLSLVFIAKYLFL